MTDGSYPRIIQSLHTVQLCSNNLITTCVGVNRLSIEMERTQSCVRERILMWPNRVCIATRSLASPA